ncbi:hypothetical protein SISNIDRAFT_493527 [Sistotremastrum niveocremeum HHB9708]|uniref:Uncharacterized protein n=1 Tax=Sistotremastrum niveocremeum HHB9708 TaxID=1314777 RepID=A0A164Z0X0_9AGAM|nr:hypothetical protein SISNIDRAFT_493527 [Sistotremastrum niveocremeum HHB9708]
MVENGHSGHLEYLSVSLGYWNKDTLPRRLAMAQLSGMLWKIAGSPFIHTFKLHYSAFPQTLHDFPLASFVEGSLPPNSSSLRNITIRVHKHFPEWHSLSCLNRFLLRHDGIINAEIRFYTQSNVEYGARTHYASLNGIPNTVPNLKTFTGDLLTAKALQSQQSLQSVRLECPPLRHGLDISCEFWKVIDAPFPGVRTLETTRAIRPSLDSGLLFEIDRCFPNLVTLRGLRLSESIIMSETENPLESESSNVTPDALQIAMLRFARIFPAIRSASQYYGCSENRNRDAHVLGREADPFDADVDDQFDNHGQPHPISKAWYSEAQRSLWSEAFVFVPSGENNIPTASRWLKSLEIMLQRGHSRYLKRLGIRLDRSSWGVPEKNAFRQSILSTTSTILDNVPHLETLLVSSDSIQLSPDLDLAGLCFSNRHFPALRTMDLLVYAGWERNHPLQLYPFLLRHPHISVLRMHVLDGTLLGTKRVPEALPHLKRFVGGMEEAKLLACQGTLQSLELFVDRLEGGQFQQRFLKLVKNIDGPFPAVKSDHQPMEEAMRLLPLSFPEIRVCSQGMGIQDRGLMRRTLSCEYGEDGNVVNWDGPEHPDSEQ